MRMFIVRSSRNFRNNILFSLSFSFNKLGTWVRPLHTSSKNCNYGHGKYVRRFSQNNFQPRCLPIAKNTSLYQAEYLTIDNDTTVNRLLYPEISNLHLEQVVSASNYQEILHITEKSDVLDVHLASQAIFSIYKLLKNSYPYDYIIYLEKLQEVSSCAGFQQLLQVVEDHFDELMENHFMDVFLALSHLLPPQNPLLLKFFVKCQKKLPNLSLRQLSEFCRIMMNLGNNYIPCVASVIGLITPLTKDNFSEENIKYLANCLSLGHMFVSADGLKKFAENLELRILQGKGMELVTAVNCLQVLVYTDHSAHVDLQQLLVSHLEVHVPGSSTSQLRQIFNVISKCTCNTNSVFTAIESRTVKLLQETRNISETHFLLNCVHRDCNALPHKLFVERWIREHPQLYADENHFHFPLLLTTLFNIYPVQNEELCSKLLEVCCSHPIRIDLLQEIVVHLIYLSRIANRNIIPKNIILELVKLCSDAAQCSFKCKDIFLFTSFIIANINPSVSVNMIERLHSTLVQVKYNNLIMISISMSLASSQMDSLPRHVRSSLIDLNQKLVNICTEQLASSKCLEEYSSLLINIEKLLSMTKSRRNCTERMVFDGLFCGFNLFLEFEHFNRKTIIKTCKLLNRQKICAPQLIQSLAHCVTEQEATQSVKVVANVLGSCYHLNHCPEIPEFFPTCQDIIIRYFQRLSCSEIVLASLSLGLFQALTDKLIQLIFCEEFVEKLQQEIAHSHVLNAKDLRVSFATLNKVVCLDYPELNLPWLHENFCRLLTSDRTGSLTLRLMEEEVFEILCELLPGEKVIRSKVYTPYFYYISFVFLLDESNCPVKNIDSIMEFDDSYQKDENSRFQRVAIHVLTKYHYCQNVPRLKGGTSLKNRHLEILGYKVVQIPFFEWYSLQLSKKKDRTAYLYNKIFSPR